MPAPLSALLEEVSRDHFPSPPATPEQLDAFERRVGWKLDPDLRAFYLHCDGAELFKQGLGCPYRILPLDEVAQWGPEAMYGLFALPEGDAFVAYTGEPRDGRYLFVIGHRREGAAPEFSPLFAPSFSVLLERVLRSGGVLFHLRFGAR